MRACPSYGGNSRFVFCEASSIASAALVGVGMPNNEEIFRSEGKKGAELLAGVRDVHGI